MKNLRPLLGGMIGVAALLVWTATASAQTYGSVTAVPGVNQTLTGVSGGVVGTPGGEIDASTYGTSATGACRGWIAPTPDHTLNVTSHMAALAIQVTTTNNGDTALVIAGPTGVMCNDDNVGLNPGLTGAFSPGTYSIWIASYSQGMNHPYTITFRDTMAAAMPPTPTPPMPGMGLITTSMTPTDAMGPIVLNTGFLPDPQTRSGVVTGLVDMNMTPNLYGGTCRGYVQANPDHIMNLTSAFSYLRVHVRSPQDTTLVIQDPMGSFWCNDDSDMLNPVIDGPWTPGLWRIWIGTYSPGNTASYTVEFTEFPR